MGYVNSLSMQKDPPRLSHPGMGAMAPGILLKVGLPASPLNGQLYMGS